jgi:alkyl hydroperoxide reductase subunit AhpC
MRALAISREERFIMIEVGKQAPDFELASHLGGTIFTLNQFKGQKNVMLVFYPLDWTPPEPRRFLAWKLSEKSSRPVTPKLWV